MDSQAQPGATLHAAALAVSSSGGQSVFDELVRFLSDILHVDAAMISIFADAERRRMRTLATCLDGRMLRSFEYEVAATPCATVVGRAFRFVGSGAGGEFAAGGMFNAKGMDSYAAYSLNAPDGTQLGLIAVMDREPLPEQPLVESVLKIFAVRAVAELERTRAAAALQASEASYRSIFEAAEDAIFIHDWHSGEILDVNPKACAVYGYARDELRRMTPDQLGPNVPPYTLRDALAWIERAKTQGPVRFEWPRRNRDGSEHWDEVTLKAATIGGQPRVLAFTREITQRKAAEEALKASEEQYRAIFNASEDAMVLWDSALRRVDINPAYERVFGYTREEVLSPGHNARLPAEYTKRRENLVRRTLAGERCHAELESLRKDGERIQIEVRTVPIRQRGEPHVLAMVRDITDRRRVEEALKASEEQYRTIFHASEDALILWDSRLQRIDVNPAYERMFGYTREEVTAPDYGANLPEDSAQRRQDLVRRSLAGERCHAEVEAIRKDGTRFLVELRTIPIRHRGEPHVLAIGRDITERRRAEEALRASEEQYRAIFNASEDAMVLWNSELRRVDVNDAYEKLYGYARAEVLAPGYGAGLAREQIERRMEFIRRGLAGERCEAEVEAVRKNGERFEIELRTVPVTYRGEPHVLAIGRDITQRRRAEEALRASEAQYRAIFNATEDALVLRDAAFRIVDVNAAYERISGYGREEVLGQARVLANPAMHEQLRALHDRALAGTPFLIETVRQTKDGQRIDVELRGVPIQHRGEPHVLYIGRDISLRKRAEEVRRASEEQYRAIFDATTDAIVLRDAAGRIVDVNPALVKISGYSREEVLSDPGWLFAAPEYRRTVRQMHDRALSGETILFEMKGVAKDGTLREVEVQCVPITYRGQPHILAMARDISLRKRAAEERLSLERQLRQAQKMEALGHLTGGIAHDFNNLLASIMGYVALAAEKVESGAAGGDGKLPGYLEEALLGCRRARDLVQQMLTFSRGQRGTPRPLALAEAAGESLKLVRSTLPATVEIRSTLPAGTPAVMLDPVQLDQILLNLSINARDAMEGAGRLAFSLRALQGERAVCSSCRKSFEGDFVELAVEDSGPGIAPAVLERMFEPFFTTKEVGRGSGMGLATVHGIVHEHGGHVVVEPGRVIGSRFRVLFPALSGAARPAAAAAPSFASPRRAPLKGRVLVVDDEASVAQFMRELLESWGLTAACATSASNAAQLFAADPSGWDLVVTDQTMPERTGVALARELIALRADLPVVLYSGHMDRGTEIESRAAGIRAVLHKPVEPEALYGVLKTHLH
jgi:PAS domain S-box-containing protein